MELPYGQMGERAARLMIDDLRGGATAPEENARITVRGELRWRVSVTPGPAIRTQ
jgi:DNA-binding LacI/PurR family transcriptional regulator